MARSPCTANRPLPPRRSVAAASAAAACGVDTGAAPRRLAASAASACIACSCVSTASICTGTSRKLRSAGWMAISHSNNNPSAQAAMLMAWRSRGAKACQRWAHCWRHALAVGLLPPETGRTLLMTMPRAARG